MSSEYLDHLNANYGPEDEWVDCWQCDGVGMTAGCCAPNRCDVCHGKGGWNPNAALSQQQGGK